MVKSARRTDSIRFTLATLGVLAMSAAAFVVLTELDAWIGDLGALLWVCACFFFPFLIGIAWGPRGRGKIGRVVGAILGGMTAVLPTAIYSLYAGLALLIPMELWVFFGPLGMAQGAISLPVGASARRRRSAA